MAPSTKQKKRFSNNRAKLRRFTFLILNGRSRLAKQQKTAGSLLTLGLWTLLIVGLPALAFAAPYLASDIIGQVNVDDTPNYTKNYPNNTLDPNTRGFSNPGYTAIDTTNHRLFLSDTTDNRVLVFNLDSSNLLIDRVADVVLGQSTFYTIAAAVSQSGLSAPSGLAYDATGNRLFVADTNNNRVLVFDASSLTNGQNAVNVLGQTGFASSTFNTTTSTLRAPSGLFYHAATQRLFVSDATNNRVMIFDASSLSDGKNASTVLGQPNFTSAVATPVTQSRLRTPSALAYDAIRGLLFVADQTNNRVLVYGATSTVNGQNAMYVLGQPTFASSTATTTANGLSAPRGVAYDQSGNRLFVSDTANNRVVTFNLGTITNGQSAANVLGQNLFTTAATTTAQNSLRGPVGLSFDATSSLLYTVDATNNRVMIFDVASITNGENAVNLLGQLDSEDNPVYFSNKVQNGGPNAKGVNLGTSVVVDRTSHRLFAVDLNNNRVLVFNLDASNNLIDHTSDNVLGQADLVSNASVISQNGMRLPIGVTIDEAGRRLFVADTTSNRIVVFDVSTITNGKNATNVLGQSSFTTAVNTTTQSGFNFAFSSVFDPTTQRLFVADTGNSRVLVFDVSSIANGEAAVNVLGQPDFISNAARITQNGMSQPRALALDAGRQRLYVADTLNNRVLVFDVSSITNGQNAVNVLGQTDFITKTLATTQSGMSNTAGVAVDEENQQLFVADRTNNNRVLTFDTSAITNGQNAMNVLGQNDFISNVSATSQSTIALPYLISYLPIEKRLYVPQGAGNRVMIFNFIRITTSSVASGIQETPYSQVVTTTNSQGAVTFALRSGSLPPGLALNASSGVISGSPTSSGAYSFTIRAFDTGNVGYFVDDQSFSMSIEAIPRIASVSSAAANGSYAVGQIIPIQVTFTEPVNVIGLPQLVLETGASDAIATYSSGSGSSILTFNYTVAAFDVSVDLDYASTTALSLNGGTIKDLSGNDANLTLATPGSTGSLGASKDLVINTAISGGGSNHGPAPLIHVTKIPSPLALPAGPGPVTYTYVLTNPGTITLTDVTLSDDKCSKVTFVGGDTNSNTWLESDETWTYTCTANLAQTTVNFATARALGGDLATVDTAVAYVVVGVPIAPPLISIVKTLSPLTLSAAGGPVTYSYVVTSPGTVPLTSISVADDKCSQVIFVSGDVNGDSILQPSETWRYRCIVNILKTTTNTAVATGHANGITAVDTALATVLVAGSPIPPPLIHVISRPDIFVLPASGGVVTYTYTVTNPGVVPLSDVTIVDDKCPTITLTSGDTNRDGLLGMNEAWTYTCTQTLRISTTNTASVTGRANGLAVTDIFITNVILSPDLILPSPTFPNTGIDPLDRWMNWVVALAGLFVSGALFLAFTWRKTPPRG